MRAGDRKELEEGKDTPPKRDKERTSDYQRGLALDGDGRRGLNKGRMHEKGGHSPETAVLKTGESRFSATENAAEKLTSGFGNPLERRAGTSGGLLWRGKELREKCRGSFTKVLEAKPILLTERKSKEKRGGGKVFRDEENQGESKSSVHTRSIKTSRFA